MRRHTGNEAEENTIELTPMLDVVFIMLIFFIVTATFIKEPGVQVLRPETETAIRKPQVSILVGISSEGDIWIDKKRVDPGAVKPNLERLYAENPKGGMVIQADQDAKYEQLLQVLNAARDAGITEVAVSTLDKYTQ